MRFVFLFLFLFIIALPALDIYLLLAWFFESPIIALLYALAAAAAGAVCIKAAKIGLGEFVRRARGAGTNLRPLFAFGKMWVVGALLLFPGYLSDFIAVVVLLFARVSVRQKTTYNGDGIQTIDGELRDDDSPPPRLDALENPPDNPPRE